MAAQQSLHGLVHGLAGTLAFGSLSAACFVLARRFAAEPGWRGWARYSTVTAWWWPPATWPPPWSPGWTRPACCPTPPGGLLQRAMIMAGFGWVVLLATRLLRRRPDHQALTNEITI